MSEQTKSGKLPLYLKNSYALADVTFILMVTLTNTYAQLFLTDFALFSTTTAASILFFGRILDALSVPVTGGIIQGANLKQGKYRPWLVIGAILTMLFNVLIFVNWNGSTGAVLPKAAACCLIYAMFCASTNLAYTGYTSLNSLLTSDPKERVALSSLRGLGSGAGRVLSGYLLLPMIAFFSFSGGSQNVKGYFITALITSAILVFGYVNLYRAVGSRDSGVAVIGGGEKAKDGGVSGQNVMRLIITNRPLLCLFGADILRILTSLVTLSIFPYFFIYVAKDPKAAPMFFGSTALASLAGAALVPLISRFLSKKAAYITGLVMLGLGFAGATVLKDNTFAMVSILVIGYVGYSFGNTLSTAMYTDVVDYGEVKYGVNARAIYFSMYQMSIKIAAICSTGIAGFGLAIIGYQAGMEPTEQVIGGINFICLVLPVALCAASVLLLLLYNLSDRKMEEIRGTLAEKHEN